MTEQEQIPIEGGTVEVTETPPSPPPAMSQDPMELATTTYGLYLPKFQALVNGLSNKQLKRVLLAAIEHPLYDAKPKFTTEQERTAFALSTHLLEAKMAMIMSTMFSKVALDQVDWSKPAEAILDQVAPQDQGTNLTGQNEGESNGKEEV